MISITDGQIYLVDDLFKSGVRPAVDVGISVSRVGGAAQIKAMRAVSGTLKLDLAQFRELEAFATFGSELDAVSKAQLERGYRLVELLKQPLNSPMPVEEQVVSIFAGTNGVLDDLPVDDVRRFESELLDYFRGPHADMLAEIRTTGRRARRRHARHRGRRLQVAFVVTGSAEARDGIDAAACTRRRRERASVELVSERRRPSGRPLRTSERVDMAGGQERILRRRIKSVQSTKKITRAMELIASSRIVRRKPRSRPRSRTARDHPGGRAPRRPPAPAARARCCRPDPKSTPSARS